MIFSVDNQGVDQFLQSRFVSGSFLQSTFWEKFLNKQGLRSWRLNISDGNRLLATCLVYEKKLPLEKSYLYAPKGPIFSSAASDQQRKEALKLILGKIRDVTVYTDRFSEVFFRMELEHREDLVPKLKRGEDVQPRETWVLYLDKTEEELAAQMHQKTRYNINLAKKHGVKSRFSTDLADLEKFLSLMNKTTERNQIAGHPHKYYKQLFETILQEDSGYLAIAEKDGQVLAANMMINFGQVTTYVHGASDYNQRQLMAPHLLQWETIQRAKSQGLTVYDFWGIAPEDGSKKRWEGFSRFKQGFGGRRINSAGAYDLVFDSGMYWLYNAARKIRKLIG